MNLGGFDLDFVVVVVVETQDAFNCKQQQQQNQKKIIVQKSKIFEAKKLVGRL